MPGNESRKTKGTSARAGQKATTGMTPNLKRGRDPSSDGGRPDPAEIRAKTPASARRSAQDKTADQKRNEARQKIGERKSTRQGSTPKTAPKRGRQNTGGEQGDTGPRPGRSS